MVWCSFHAQWKWCFLNWLVNSTDSGLSAVHLQEENDMTSKRRKLQFMLLPVNLAATYNTWLSNFVVNYKYEKFWDDHRFLSFSFYNKIGSLCLNDFLRFSGLPDKKTLFLKEGTCIISKEFAPKITRHSKIIVSYLKNNLSDIYRLEVAFQVFVCVQFSNVNKTFTRGVYHLPRFISSDYGVSIRRWRDCTTAISMVSFL